MADAESIFATITADPYLSATVVSYTTLLNGYVRAATRPGLGNTGGDGGGPVEGGLQMAEDIFYRRIFEAGIVPSTVTLTALANGYLDAARPFDALWLMDGVTVLTGAGVPGDRSSDRSNDGFGGNAVGGSGEASGVMEVMEVRPDRSFMNVLLKCLSAVGDVDGLLQLINAMAATNNDDDDGRSSTASAAASTATASALMESAPSTPFVWPSSATSFTEMRHRSSLLMEVGNFISPLVKDYCCKQFELKTFELKV